jgi:hypothetical protein
MGGGVFYERVATFGIGITSDYTTNPPNSRTPQLYYGNLANIATSAGTFFPTNVNMMSPDSHSPRCTTTMPVFNGSFRSSFSWMFLMSAI